jgi:hypothetical protein
VEPAASRLGLGRLHVSPLYELTVIVLAFSNQSDGGDGDLAETSG